MLAIVLAYAVAFSIMAAAVGSTVGLIARRRNWSAKRIYQTANFSFFACIIVVGLVLEFLLRVDLPWPPRALAQQGFPLSTAVAVLFLSLFSWLAGTLARRLHTSTPSFRKRSLL